MTRYDAVVIGAGHNGLAAAIHLAAKGWKVVVVEAASEAGGAIKTREVTAPGFRHDLFAMSLSLFAQSSFRKAYARELEAHGLDFVPVPKSFASVFPDGTYLGVSTDLEETVTAITALSRRDGAAWSAMLDDFHHKAPYIFGLLHAPMPSWESAKIAWSAWRAGGSPLLLDLARLLVSSPSEFLDRHFESHKLKVMMAAWAGHLDFAPESAGGALFSYLQSMASQFHPMMLGKGGADTIVNATVSLLKAKGGELLLSSRVSTVVTEGDRAVGVTLSDGRTLLASRAVISNAHPRLLFGSMLGKDDGRAAFDAAVAKFRPGPATMMIHLALDDLPDWSASREVRDFAYVHIADDMDALNRTYYEAKAGLLPAEPLLVVGQPTAFDGTRAPPGKHALWVQVRFVPYEVRGDAAGKIADRDWDSMKDAFADRVVAIIERHAPGLSASVRARHVMSPKDLERENANLIEGDGISGSHHLDQNFLFRPLAGYSRYATPVRNLHICGAATWPGAGVGAGSGFMLAKMLAG